MDVPLEVSVRVDEAGGLVRAPARLADASGRPFDDDNNADKTREVRWRDRWSDPIRRHAGTPGVGCRVWAGADLLAVATCLWLEAVADEDMGSEVCAVA